ncbi:LuxR family transcriptional regulator [Aquabacterium soli]|uniref:LuxR family transcriptional regulator n=1 Tax=Aquabacterium soli TaxID=2493092 RepID=A0A3R8U6U6_9BURK|nr:helix-turn-helix transcriptional regulator [Aquabacterium soli]RRS05893.1 LuxR family transcriptional regulator [Aquabacterium soli]
MQSAREFDDLMASLYEAALQPSFWAEALSRLSRWVGGADLCHVLGWDVQDGSALFHLDVSPIYDADALLGHDHLYFGTYRAMDPRMSLLERPLARSAVADHQFLESDFVSRSEFYQDYLMGIKRVRWSAGARLYRDDLLCFDLAIERVHDRPPFSPADLSRLDQVIGHLRRALLLYWRMVERDMHHALSARCVNTVDHGLIALDSFGRIVSMNARGEAMLRNGRYVLQKEGLLLAASAVESRGLRAAFDQVVHAEVASSLRLFGLRSKADDDQGSCAVMLVRAPVARPATKAGSWFSSCAHVICLLSCQSDERSPNAYQLMDLFGLTAGEGRVARLLARGLTAEECAHELGLSVNTLRTHIKAVVQKSGARSLADLYRCLARLPSARYPQDHRR